MFRHFYWALQKHPAIQRNIVLYGGACRDFLHGSQPKDLDLVYQNSSDYSNEEILKEVLLFAFKKFLLDVEKQFPKIKIHHNKYGSLVLDLDGILIDIWEIKDTWIFHEKNLPNKRRTFLSLKDFSPLSSDMIIYHFNGAMTIDSYFQDSLKYKTLYSNEDKVSDKKYHAQRIMKIAHKYGWGLSGYLNDYVKKQLKVEFDQYDWDLDELQILKVTNKSFNKKIDWSKMELKKQISSSNSDNKLQKIDVMKYLGLSNSVFEELIPF